MHYLNENIHPHLDPVERSIADLALPITGQALAVIPARYGSKGLPRKNLKELGGKPLVAWSVEQAVKCPGIGRVIVSTDSEEIAEIAVEYGGEVPFIRPADLAGDTSLVGDVISHAMSHVIASGDRMNAVLTLYPSHPFRTLHMLNTAVKALTEWNCSSFKTVKPVNVCPDRFARLEGETVKPLGLNKTMTSYYRSYGLVSGQSHPNNFGPAYVYPLHDAASLIDIDEERDLVNAQAVLDRGLYDFHA